MAVAKKKQDEKHLALLRELASLSENKYCFDCRQRGPTYVNMTVSDPSWSLNCDSGDPLLGFRSALSCVPLARGCCAA